MMTTTSPSCHRLGGLPDQGGSHVRTKSCYFQGHPQWPMWTCVGAADPEGLRLGRLSRAAVEPPTKRFLPKQANRTLGGTDPCHQQSFADELPVAGPGALAKREALAAVEFAALASRIVTDTFSPVEVAVCSVRQPFTRAEAQLGPALDLLSHQANQTQPTTQRSPTP
jgi:hypothetical protein